MQPCDVSDICTELTRLQQRLQRHQEEFATWIRSAPAWALHLLEVIAADRVRQMALSLLANGLSFDYDRWAQAPITERMCAIGFRRVSRRRDLYVRRTRDGVEISDLFGIVQIDPEDLEALIFSLRQIVGTGARAGAPATSAAPMKEGNHV